MESPCTCFWIGRKKLATFGVGSSTGRDDGRLDLLFREVEKGRLGSYSRNDFNANPKQPLVSQKWASCG